MLVPVETAIDGLVRTLLEAVLPDVGTRFARGQLYAVVDILRNLRDRVEPKAALADAEAESALTALDQAEAACRGAGAVGEAARIADAVRAVPAAPPIDRATALRGAVSLALEVVDGLPPDAAAPARAAIAAHLTAQAFRDLAVLKPSLLTEISKG